MTFIFLSGYAGVKGSDRAVSLARSVPVVNGIAVVKGIAVRKGIAMVRANTFDATREVCRVECSDSQLDSTYFT